MTTLAATAQRSLTGKIALGLILAAITSFATAQSDMSYTLNRIDGEATKPAAVARDFIVVLEDKPSLLMTVA